MSTRAAWILSFAAVCSPWAAWAGSPGTLDPGFGTSPGGGLETIPFDLGGSWWDLAQALAVQLDGKVVAVGGADRGAGDLDFAVARFDAAGQLDPLFGTFPGGGKTVIPFDLRLNGGDVATAVAIQGDGKIVVGGFVETSTPSGDALGVARLLASGALDPSFGAGGKVVVPIDVAGTTLAGLWDLVIQPDGRIVLAGYTRTEPAPDHNYDFLAVRLRPDGSLDPAFGAGGKKTVGFDLGGDSHDAATAVALQADGKIVLAGHAEVAGGFRWALVRLTASGSLDSSFGTGGKRTIAVGGPDHAWANDLALQSDGRIVVVGGAFVFLPASPDFTVARLLPDGALDPSFDGDGMATVAFDAGGSDADFAKAVAIQYNGKIVLGGEVSKGTDDRDFGVARLLPNGAADPSFGSGGRALAGFDFGQSDADVVTALALRLDGRLVIAGTVERLATGDSDFGIVQLFGDPTFVIGPGGSDPPPWPWTSP